MKNITKSILMLTMGVALLLVTLCSCSSYKSSYHFIHGCSSARGMAGYGR